MFKVKLSSEEGWWWWAKKTQTFKKNIFFTFLNIDIGVSKQFALMTDITVVKVSYNHCQSVALLNITAGLDVTLPPVHSGLTVIPSEWMGYFGQL